MILFFMFILVSIAPLSLHADENFLPSFRSSVVTNGKPILRGGGPEPEEEDEKTDTGNVELKEEDTTETQEKATKGELERNNMVNSVTVLLDWLINSYGYKIDNNLRRAGDGPDSGPLEEEFRSHRQKQSELVPQRRSDARSSHAAAHKIRQTLRRKRRNESKIKKDYKHGVRRRHQMYGARRSLSRRANNNATNITSASEPIARARFVNEPRWKVDLKSFVKELISRIPRSNTERYLVPVVKAVETKNNVKITDIDVDQYGHVMVDHMGMSRDGGMNKLYVDRRKRKNGKGVRKGKYSESSIYV